jgi:hypothetical protein
VNRIWYVIYRDLIWQLLIIAARFDVITQLEISHVHARTNQPLWKPLVQFLRRIGPSLDYCVRLQTFVAIRITFFFARYQVLLGYYAIFLHYSFFPPSYIDSSSALFYFSRPVAYHFSVLVLFFFSFFPHRADGLLEFIDAFQFRLKWDISNEHFTWTLLPI